MRGSITQVSGDGSGCILAEDGNEVYFERSGIGSGSVDDLMVGHWVEFKLQYGFERSCAVNVKRLQRDAGQRLGSTGWIVERNSRYGHRSCSRVGWGCTLVYFLQNTCSTSCKYQPRS
jgi:hypothetical protein